MARLLRVDCPGLWYHLTARGNERRTTFRDDRDREHFLELLGQWVERFCFRLHAYVIMALVEKLKAAWPHTTWTSFFIETFWSGV